MGPRELAALAGRHLDLVRAPFTRPGSRILVFDAARRDRSHVPDEPAVRLSVHTAEYERGLAECTALSAVELRDQEGLPLPVTRVLPHVIEFGGGRATLGFAADDTLTIAGADVELEWTDALGRSRAVHLDGAGVRMHVAADRTVSDAPSAAHEADLERDAALWHDWFAKCPVVRDDLQEMTAFCWWVLGANIVTLPHLGGARAVVPSKIGYVGLWQWDAYFIAVGLRHGDPALAREQLELAFRFPSPDGQLPDVVHEEGVLATSDDLPAADRDRLRRAGSEIADPASAIALTKPPLAAWALRKVLEVEPAQEWARAQLAIVRRSQDWWFAGSDLDGDGMPEYGHPYSSGLDDSPIFDGPLPTTSPDLGAYLVLQDRELARFAVELGDAPARPHLQRAARTERLLLDMWNAERGQFCARAAGRPVDSDAVTGLMPLLTGTLPDGVRDALVDALQDPDRYGAPWGIPTVAVRDPDFSPERMWRGPIWINTTVLVAEGLRASGRSDLADALAERAVRLVLHAGGPHEYFHPFTGQKARTATTAFGWSAALFVDLAVGLTARG